MGRWGYTAGGLLFKIYIVGETIKVVRRFSLPNVSKHELLDVDGLFRFPRVSCAAASADEADLDPNIAGEAHVLSISVSKNNQTKMKTTFFIFLFIFSI